MSALSFNLILRVGLAFFMKITVPREEKVGSSLTNTIYLSLSNTHTHTHTYSHMYYKYSFGEKNTSYWLFYNY